MGCGGELLGILARWFTRRSKNTVCAGRWKLWVRGVCTCLRLIGKTGGWLITELGRYPWIVYGLLTIADGVSPTATVASMLFTNIVYFLLFLLLGAVMIIYSRRVLYQGPDGDGAVPGRHGDRVADASSAERSVALA